MDLFRSLTNGRQLVANVNYREGPLLHLTLFDPELSKDELATLNGEMVKEGYASVDRKGKRYHSAYSQLVSKLDESERQAKRDRAGMWEYGDAVDDENDRR